MRKPLIFLLLIASLSAWSQQITIKESEAKITFVFTADDVKGSLGGFQFTGAINLSALETSELSGSVETKSLDTNNWLRSRHLRAAKYFNAGDFPKLSFKSNKIYGNPLSFVVEGLLSIKGIEKAVVWEFTNKGNSLVGKTAINTKDFDITINKEWKENNVTMRIEMPYN